MNAWTTLVAHIEPAKSVQPGQRPLDDPPGATEPAAMWPIAAREHGRDAALAQLVAVPLGVVSAIALHDDGFPAGWTRSTADRGHGVNEVEQLADVVAVGGGQPRDERNPLRVGKKVMFRPGLAAIGRVRSSFFPPRNARSEALSTTARARSSWPRRRNSVSILVRISMHARSSISCGTNGPGPPMMCSGGAPRRGCTCPPVSSKRWPIPSHGAPGPLCDNSSWH